MSQSKSRLPYLLPILLSLAVVLGGCLFLRATAPAQVLFTADTVLSLAGIADGDVYIAQDSECAALEVSGGDLSVSAIPTAGAFTLKTDKHARALRVSAAAGSVDLDFSAANLSAGDITTWTLTPRGATATADIIWGVPAAATRYQVLVNGQPFDSFASSPASEIAFSYQLSAPSVFTLELATGGTPFLPPGKPDVSGVVISDAVSGGLVFAHLPSQITQVAVSTSSDFAGASWEDISGSPEIQNPADDACRVYVRFRSQGGGVSDPLVYFRNPSHVVEGDIVKTADNFDVYIIKFMSGKRFKRLILSPSVFESYQHLRWENIRVIPQAEMDSYATSSLVQVAGDATLYQLFPDGDTGDRSKWNLADYYDADSVYEINRTDRDSYILIDPESP